MDAISPSHRGSRPERMPELERIREVRIRTVASFELIDPVTLFYGLAIAAGAVAGMVAATLRFG